MTRRRAITWTCLLCLVLTGYTVWCTRIFFVKPKLSLPAEMTDESRSIVTGWYEDQTEFGKVPLNYNEFINAMANPLQKDVQERVVRVFHLTLNESFVIAQFPPPWKQSLIKRKIPFGAYPSVSFVKEKGKWTTTYHGNISLALTHARRNHRQLPPGDYFPRRGPIQLRIPDAPS